ncbi:hypothetical protein N7475_002684 [Penicillium sp. IBT 31633x]|nr:hypothetical protein N7475_002684 [Penicillium sp. IBT 31633x]
MTLGRMIHFYIPERKLAGISARHYGLVFVALDIFAFLVQLGGAALTTNTGEETKIVLLGLHIYMGGIGMQEFFILCFLGLAIHLHRTIIRIERAGLIGMEKLQPGPISWRWLFYSIYFSLAMITIRIIFRIGEYAQGTSATNPVLTHEEYEYVFDAAPMFLALVALNIVHPGRILQGTDSTFPKRSQTERNELKAQKKAVRMEKKQKQHPLSAIN